MEVKTLREDSFLALELLTTRVFDRDLVHDHAHIQNFALVLGVDHLYLYLGLGHQAASEEEEEEEEVLASYRLHIRVRPAQDNREDDDEDDRVDLGFGFDLSYYLDHVLEGCHPYVEEEGNDFCFDDLEAAHAHFLVDHYCLIDPLAYRHPIVLFLCLDPKMVLGDV